jgi:hypothetical protein
MPPTVFHITTATRPRTRDILSYAQKITHAPALPRLENASRPSSMTLSTTRFDVRADPRQRDPALERILPRVATATAGRTVPCKDPKPHRRRALAEGFLAPGLAFWVPGSGDANDLVSSGSTNGPDCGGPEVGYGRGRPGRPRPREEFAPLVGGWLVAREYHSH